MEPFILRIKDITQKSNYIRMYPKITKLFSLKKQYDPQEIFSNSWYEQFNPHSAGYLGQKIILVTR